MNGNTNLTKTLDLSKYPDAAPQEPLRSCSFIILAADNCWLLRGLTREQIAFT